MFISGTKMFLFLNRFLYATTIKRRSVKFSVVVSVDNVDDVDMLVWFDLLLIEFDASLVEFDMS